MYRTLAVLATLAFCLASADYYNYHTANEEFLLKQKRIYNLLYNVAQPNFVEPEVFKEGQSYNFEASMNSFSNQSVVDDFLYLYKRGMLRKDEIFSVYYPKHLNEAVALFRVFYYANNFDAFYHVAAWARIYVNKDQFVFALYNAVIRRPDTVNIQLPPYYEVNPYGFFNSDLMEKAHHPKVYGTLGEESSAGYKMYVIPTNYTGWYIGDEYDQERKLNYFTEDIGLNLYYFYFRQENPFWLKSEQFDLFKYRGEEYLYGHKQLMTRYYLERLANDLGKIEEFDWQSKFSAGYYPTMMYHNGMPYPQRPHWSSFPYYKYKYIRSIYDMELRVSSAIDSGFIIDKSAKFVDLKPPFGLNYLGNIIEGNEDSFNNNFYGSIDYFGRKIFGHTLEPMTPNQILPSAMESFATSMKDPAFYRFYKRIAYYYYRYKLLEKPYYKEDLVHPYLEVKSFAVDKLVTYFDQFDTTLNNGLMHDNLKDAETYLVKARQQRLNHKPFNFHITINSEHNTKAAIRIFLGPKYDAERKLLRFDENIRYFYEIDNWIVNLSKGVTKITRKSSEGFFLSPDPEPSEVIYKKVIDALQNNGSYEYQERLYGFPERLLLPKGRKEGFPLRLFIFVNPVTELIPYKSRIFGNYAFDDKPFGYPLDKPSVGFEYDGPNMLLKDVYVYHNDETFPDIPYNTYNIVS